ncbi:hypothetical protein BsWGS_23415 [Bradybaena similaris]
MEIVKAVLAALAIVFAAAEIQLQLSKRQGTTPSSGVSRPSCQQRLAPCYELLRVISFSVFNPALPSLVDNIDSNCTTYQQAVDCVQPLLSECGRSETSSIEATLSEWEYICSARGRSLLREANSSRCYTDNKKLCAVSDLMDACLSSWKGAAIQSDVVGDVDPCQSWQRIVLCTRQKITHQCGQTVGAFFTEYVNRTIYARIPSCQPVDSTQLSVKRGV